MSSQANSLLIFRTELSQLKARSKQNASKTQSKIEANDEAKV